MLRTAANSNGRLDHCVQLLVNLPAFRLDVHAGFGGFSFSVAIGVPDSRTPLGDYNLHHIAWKSQLSCACQSDKAALPRSTGIIEVPFHAPLAIHSVPGARINAGSSTNGCVQLNKLDAIRLASILLGGSGLRAPRWRAASADTSIPLVPPASLHIVYNLVEIRDGTLLVHRDVYGLASELRGEITCALHNAGVTDIHPSFLDALVDVASEESLAVPLSRVLHGHRVPVTPI